MNTPRVSVAMSVYNGDRYLAAAVESILAQTFTDFEFLIVDDGSTDGSGEVLARYAAADPRIRIISQTNSGLIASLNRLLDEARAPLVARMDADDIALPNRLERQVSFLDANPGYGVIGSWSDCMDECGNPWKGCMDFPASYQSFLEAVRNRQPLLCHSSVVMRRDLVRAVGGYYRAYVHCEDYDLWLRLSERTKMCSLPERLIRYRHSEGQISSRNVIALQTGAAIAYFAHCERLAGRPDPTEALERLPPIEELDALFGREGVSRQVRSTVARGIVYSPVALRGAGFAMLMDHVREGGERQGLWRTAARLVKLGEPRLALRLASALAAA